MRITAELAETTARAAISEPYRQIDVLTTREFTDWLRKRGIALQWTTLHQLWHAGIVRPIAVLEPAVDAATSIGDRLVAVDLGFDVPSYVDLGADAPLATELEPGRDLPGRLSKSLLWHPFQLWPFMWLARILEPRIALDVALFGRASFVNTSEHVVSTVPEGLIQFVSSASNGGFERVLALLLTAEPLIHVRVNSRIRTRPSRGESFEDYYRWIEAQDGRSLLASVGLDLAAVTKWHGEIAVRAQIEDPVECFRELFRHANRDRRERMTDAALRSHTLYDMAEVLRRYVEAYHDTELLEEDDARHGPGGPAAKERLYGAPRTADFDRAVFRRIARRFELDPQARTTWFVEGYTEVGFIERLSKHLHLDLPQSGVEIMNIKGLGALAKDHLRGLLERYRREETFVFISADQDDGGDHLRILRIYGREGLASAGFRVWRRDFEEENFSIDELASAASFYANRGGINAQITADEIRCVMNSGNGRRIPVGDALERLWKRAFFYGGKGLGWGEALADWVFESGELSSVRSREKQRPVVETIKRVIQGQWSDYQATAQLCIIDDDGNVVRKADAL